MTKSFTTVHKIFLLFPIQNYTVAIIVAVVTMVSNSGAYSE